MLSEFDPWKSKLCTCPPKLTFNPYTGCDHKCVYCYASSYIPKFYNCRPKKNLLRRLGREARKLGGELIAISNSSDPYPTIEEENSLTRKSLEILSRHKCKIQIITKSPLVARDIDLLRKMRCMVAFSITTHDDRISRRLEPRAPVSSERLEAIEALVEKSIPVAVRIDPIIPFLNDKPKRLIESLSSLGVSHITSSTYKVRADNWRRFSNAFPEVAKKISSFYFEEGERISRYLYLPKEIRYQLMKEVKEITEENDMKFGCCREGFIHLNSASCDGSWPVL